MVPSIDQRPSVRDCGDLTETRPPSAEDSPPCDPTNTWRRYEARGSLTDGDNYETLGPARMLRPEPEDLLGAGRAIVSGLNSQAGNTRRRFVAFDVRGNNLHQRSRLDKCGSCGALFRLTAGTCAHAFPLPDVTRHTTS